MSASHPQAAEFKENTGLDYSTEDELAAPLKPSRNTLRSPLIGGPSPPAPKVTPYADVSESYSVVQRSLAQGSSLQLRKLAAIVRKPLTPRRRASSVGPPLSHRHVNANTPNTSRVRRPLTERSNPSTPHAFRAFQQRRATPGRDRRKSGRLQRETPRDALRNLSKGCFSISIGTRLC